MNDHDLVFYGFHSHTLLKKYVTHDYDHVNEKDVEKDNEKEKRFTDCSLSLSFIDDTLYDQLLSLLNEEEEVITEKNNKIHTQNHRRKQQQPNTKEKKKHQHTKHQHHHY